MLMIRLQRVSKKNQPFFRIVVTEKSKSSTAGRSVEILGFLNPLKKEKNLKAERIKYWLSVGAQPPDTVHNLLVSEKIIEGKKIAVHKKSKKKAEGQKEPAVVKGEVKEEKAKEADASKKESVPEKPEAGELAKEEKPEEKKEEASKAE